MNDKKSVYIIGTLNGVEALRAPWSDVEAAAKHIDEKSEELQMTGAAVYWADGRWVIGRGDEVITLRVEVVEPEADPLDEMTLDEKIEAVADADYFLKHGVWPNGAGSEAQS